VISLIETISGADVSGVSRFQTPKFLQCRIRLYLFDTKRVTQKHTVQPQQPEYRTSYRTWHPATTADFSLLDVIVCFPGESATVKIAAAVHQRHFLRVRNKQRA